MTGNESVSAIWSTGDRRLDAHAPQQVELGLVLRLDRAEQGDVALSLGHLGLAHVEQRGLAHLVARLGERQEVGVPRHLLPGDRDLGGRLQGGQVLGRDLRPQRDAGAADVLVGGALQRLLLAPGR